MARARFEVVPKSSAMCLRARGVRTRARLKVRLRVLARAKFEVDSWAGAVNRGARQVRGGFMGKRCGEGER